MEFLLVKQIVVPVALFLCITYAFKAVLDAVARYRTLKEGISEALLAEQLRHEARERRLAALRWGLFLVAVGLAFALIQVLGWTRPSAGSVALLAVCCGAGQLFYYRLAQRAA